MNGNQVAFVGLPSRGLLSYRFEKGDFLLVWDTSTINTLTDKTSRLVFNDDGVTPHQEDFCFKFFVSDDFVTHYRCQELVRSCSNEWSFISVHAPCHFWRLRYCMSGAKSRAKRPIVEITIKEFSVGQTRAMRGPQVGHGKVADGL